LIAPLSETTSALDGLRVFLAAPFVQLIDQVTGAVTPIWEDRIVRLAAALSGRGATVFSAHINEEFGRSALAPDACVPSDYAAMVACDLVVAYPGNPVSSGVSVELGWASALHKPIYVFDDNAATYSPMIEALWTVTPVLRGAMDASWSSEDIDRMVTAIGAWRPDTVKATGNMPHSLSGRGRLSAGARHG
jgi:nucleoside 2-deoxyribosyltransferase